MLNKQKISSLFTLQFYQAKTLQSSTMRGSREGATGPDHPPPLGNGKHIGYLSNTGPVPLENYKATKPAYILGPSSARQRNAI